VIVVDASAMTELLLQTQLGSRVEARLFRDGDDVHAPHLLDVEVVQALRRLVRTGDVPIARAEDAMEDLTLLDILRHPHVDLLDRVWQLRDNITAYDGIYVALAEAFDASLVTCDGPLGAAPGHAARIEVIR
jgi:predicted nucleic acid-binding protein